MNHEEAFAEEAQEEAMLSEETDMRSGVETPLGAELNDERAEEDSPLMNPRRRRGQRTSYSRARTSYERAIHEPWHGAQGSEALPWYKKPSVRRSLPFRCGCCHWDDC